MSNENNENQVRKILAPTGIAKPASTYHHGVVFESPRRIAKLSGQLGERADSSISSDFIEQAEQAWANVAAILAEADMTVADISKVTSYIVRRDDILDYCEVHRKWVGDHTPPWTLVLVPGLGAESYLVEVDVEAIQ